MIDPKPERLIDIAGLRTTAVGLPDAPLTLVLLHGYAMRPADLSPFAHSLGTPACFLLPEGPHPSSIGGHAWWTIDLEAREAALSRGPRDLTEDYPQGLAAARHQLGRFLDAATAEFPARPLVLGGFSQGGMLALDWQPHRARLRELPVFISHGSADPDLAFAAGERLRDFVLESGARASWVPFEGGHEIPLVVWRGLRKFLSALLE
jgi:phospholipase/carboxylesterase